MTDIHWNCFTFRKWRMYTVDCTARKTQHQTICRRFHDKKERLLKHYADNFSKTKQVMNNYEEKPMLKICYR